MKVLILAYDFPPLVSIGALRPYSWYKYLPEYEIETTVVSRYWAPGSHTWQEQISATPEQQTGIETGPLKKLIRVPFIPGWREKTLLILQADKWRRLRQLITFLYSYLEYFGMQFDSRANLYYAAKAELKKGGYDYIVATGRPFILFKYASRLAREFSLPWIADYRDSWTLNHVQGGYTHSFASTLHNDFYKVKERKYLQNAALITTVAPSYAAVMPPYFPKEKIDVIYNGYDDEVVESIKTLAPRRDKFIIAYAGTIYPMQKLEMFLEGFKIFVRKAELSVEQVEVNFWGLKEDAAAVQRIENYREALPGYVLIHPKSEYKEAMMRLSDSHILLLLTSDSDDWLNAKLFDYIALKRGILMVGNRRNVMTDIVDTSKSGVSLEEPVEIAAYLYENYRRFTSGESMVNEPVNYRQYSRKSQALVFSQLLKSN